MFSIQSAKELADHIEKRIFKDKNPIKLKSEDPETGWDNKQKANQSSTTIHEINSQEPNQKKTQKASHTQSDKQITLSAENIPKRKEDKQNIKNETGKMEGSLQITKLKPFLQKIRVAFSKYVIENVSVSASKIRDLIRDKYEEVEENSVMELEQSLGSLDCTTKWREQNQLIKNEENSNIQFILEENSAYQCEKQGNIN